MIGFENNPSSFGCQSPPLKKEFLFSYPDDSRKSDARRRDSHRSLFFDDCTRTQSARSEHQSSPSKFLSGTVQENGVNINIFYFFLLFYFYFLLIFFTFLLLLFYFYFYFYFFTFTFYLLFLLYFTYFDVTELE